ncbi:PRC-barrel domain-containing protein [Candidatus Peregrinibacteria bacterium]|nr:PRC-barrel domain-containing protein [Candidatus Peregrinibacteria bacterium]
MAKSSAIIEPMYISAQQLFGSDIYDQEGHLIGKIKRAIFSPDNGQILALELLKSSPNLLSPKDIHAWKKGYLVIAQETEFHTRHDLIRIQRLFDQNNTTLLGKPVQTVSGQKLGKVTDYSINTIAQSLASITTHKSFFIFYYDTRLIHQKNIHEITPKAVIVKDTNESKTTAQNIHEKFDLHNSPTFDQALFSPEDRTFL